MLQRIAFASLLFIATLHVSAKDIFVDPDRGDDSADGLSATVNAGHGPVKTTKAGLALAVAGDTVNLAPRKEPYHETVMIHEQSGGPGKPIIIDGHGATVTGCDPLDPKDWKQESPGLYKSDTIFGILKGDDALIQRMFFLYNGQMQRMGRTSKGTKAPWKKPEDLAPGEWTYLPESTTFYIKTDPAKELANAGFEIPYRENGLAVRGKQNAHWIIRNLIATHVVNDGFNLHTNASDMLFQNIASYECGDDGFSAHEGCVCTVDGYQASGNSTGFANGFPSDITLKNAYLHGNHAMEILQIQESKFSVQNAYIVTEAEQPLVIRGNPAKQQVCRGSLDNVLIRYTGNHPKMFLIGKGAVVDASRITTIGLSWQVEGELHVSQSVMAPAALGIKLDIEPDAIWKAKQNVYCFRSFGFDGNLLGSDLAAFQKACGSDEGSRAEAVSEDVRKDLLAEKAVFAPSGAALADVTLPTAQP